ncbi:MAG TPA: hypothetical protein VFJ16_31170 [Longimicrobium sp.]|nr:hypothetical protein [Longimicrobium sp.]
MMAFQTAVRTAVIIATVSGCIAIPPILAPSTTLSGAPTQTSLRSSYDAMTDRSYISAPLFARTPSHGPLISTSLSVTYKGNVEPVSGFPTVILGVFAYGENWALLRESDLVLLVDGNQRLAYKGYWGGDVGRDASTVETVSYAIPAEDFQRISTAKSLEGRMGIWSFTLTEEEISHARQLGLYLRHDPSAPRPVVITGVRGGIPLEH